MLPYYARGKGNMKLFVLVVAALVAVGLAAGCGSAGPALLQGNGAEKNSRRSLKKRPPLREPFRASKGC